MPCSTFAPLTTVHAWDIDASVVMLITCMRRPANVSQLTKEDCPRVFGSFSNILPALDMRFGVNARDM